MATHVDRRDFLRGMSAVSLGYLIGNDALRNTAKIYSPKLVLDWLIVDNTAEGKQEVGTMKLTLDAGVLGPDGSLDVNMFSKFFDNPSKRRMLDVDLGNTSKMFRLNFDYGDLGSVVVKARMESGDINDRSCIQAELKDLDRASSPSLMVLWEDLEIKQMFLNGKVVEISQVCEWPRFSLLPPALP